MKWKKRTMLSLLFLAYFMMVGAAISGLWTLLEQADRVFTDDQVAAKIMTQMFSGTIEGIDPAGLSIIIQTEMGMGSLPVVSAEVMQGLTQGDHVTVALDEQGYVLKITKHTSVPKLAPRLGS